MRLAEPRSMKKIAAFSVLMCTAVFGAPALAASVTVTCPIDGKPFQYEAPPTTTNPERYLDMRPVEMANAPWPLPKCPENGFVIYKKNISASKIRKLRNFVASQSYRSMVNVHNTYYLAAVLRRRVEEPPYDIAWSLAQASWGVSADPAQYKQYAEEALTAYNALPDGTKLPRRENVLREMISGELERRLGRFDAAEKRFRRIRDEAEFSTPQLQRVIELQLKLIAAKDSGNYRMPR